MTFARFYLLTFIFIIKNVNVDAAVAKNSIPFDPFRLECPSFHALVKLNFQRVESTEGIRSDILITTFCDNMKKLYPSPRDDSLTDADESCRWTPNFQIPSEDFDITHTCRGKEFMTGISRQAIGEYGFLCCQVKDRKKGSCATVDFTLPTGGSPAVELAHPKRILTALGNRKGSLTAQFCEMEVMSREEVDLDQHLRKQGELLTQHQQDLVKNIPNGREHTEANPAPFNQPSLANPFQQFSPPGVRPPGGQGQPRGRSQLAQLRLPPNPENEDEEASEDQVDNPDELPVRLASVQDGIAVAAVNKPSGSISHAARPASAKRLSAVFSPQGKLPNGATTPQSTENTSAGDSEADAGTAEDESSGKEGAGDGEIPDSDSLPTKPPRKHNKGKTASTVAPVEIDDAGDLESTETESAPTKQPQKGRRTRKPTETPGDETETEASEQVESTDGEAPEEEASSNSTKPQIPVDLDELLKERKLLLQRRQGVSTSEGGDEDSGVLGGTVAPSGPIRNLHKAASILPVPPAKQRVTLPPLPPAAVPSDEDPPQKAGSGENERESTASPTDALDEETDSGSTPTPAPTSSPRPNKINKKKHTTGKPTNPGRRTGTVTSKRNGVVRRLQSAIAGTSSASSKPKLTVLPKGSTPSPGSPAPPGASAPSPPGKNSPGARGAPSAASTAKPFKRLECDTETAWKDPGTGLVTACGQGDDVWTPARCKEGLLCLVSKDSTYRLCCEASLG